MGTIEQLGRLRVCHVASGDLWAGAEVQLATLLCELRKDPSFDVSAILLNEGILYDRLRASGISTQVMDERAISSVGLAKQIYQFCKAWKPHVVHTHRYKENCLGGLAASRAHVPVIVHTVHGIHEALAGWKNVKWKLYSVIARQITRRVATGLIGVSLEISSVLKRDFPGLEVVCIHNGIQYDAAAETNRTVVSREGVGITGQAFVVGAVGRLTSVKGIEYLLQAASLLVREEKVPSIQVVLVGEGPLRTTLEALAQHLGIDERVLFFGERQDVPRLLRLFDVFVMPSLHEGIPMALLEALAEGCPVIASAVGGVPEIVRDGKDGMLVPSKDPAAIAEAIQALYESQSLRARFRRAGSERVATAFAASRMATCTKEFYVDLVNQASAY